MRINCTIDGKNMTLYENGDKPLNLILMEKVDNFRAYSSCTGARCGNCVVCINNSIALSCLVPACTLDGKVIETFEYFRNTQDFTDIERAYSDFNVRPCPQCYAAKTLIIDSIVTRMIMNKSMQADSRKIGDKNITDGDFSSFVSRELGISTCGCVEMNDLVSIVKTAYGYRDRNRCKDSTMNSNRNRDKWHV